MKFACNGRPAARAVVWMGLLGAFCAVAGGFRGAAVSRVEGVPGWAAVYTAGSGGVPITTHASKASFDLGRGETIHPSVAADETVMSFQGDVVIDEPGRYRFGASFGGGSLRLSVSGAGLARPVVLDEASPRVTTRLTSWVDLEPGVATVQCVMRRTGEGRCRLRIMWERAEPMPFGLEPISSAHVRVPTSRLAEVEGGRLADHGRTLMGKFGCVNCHDGGDEGAAAVSKEPAPDLTRFAGGFGGEWLVRWIADPQTVKPGCGMPDVVAGGGEDLAQYIASLASNTRSNDEAPPATALVEAGRDLYHTLGCVACHGSPDGDDGFEPAAPFGDLRLKWRAGALARFLIDPSVSHPSGRMPSFGLDDTEAASIAAYLTDRWNDGEVPSPLRPDAAMAARGKMSFMISGCSSCHVVEDASQRRRSKPLASLRVERGCMSTTDRDSPRYTFTPEQRAALAAAIGGAGAWVANEAPMDRLHRTVEALNCRACHEWDGSGGVDGEIAARFALLDEDADLGDEGRLPPRLTGVGWKLTTPWIEEVLLNGGRARPYMAARMPQFGEAHVGDLGELLARSNGVRPRGDVRMPDSTNALTRGGRELVGDGGINCISCHVFGDAPRAGTPGPNLKEFAGRLRYEWFRRFVHNPDRFKPGTRMLNPFATGRGTVTSVFGGDPDKQTDALWSYFQLGDAMPPPEGLPSAGGIPITVGLHPVVMRTFLESAGSRGIAVGFPEGVHGAFDADGVRLVEVWQGAFLNAAGAWAGRGGQVTGGQGRTVWEAAEGPAIVVSSDRPRKAGTGRDGGYHFRGYRLDDGGVPIFLYRIDRDGTAARVQVEERIAPDKSGALFTRSFNVDGVPTGEFAWIAGGAKVGVRDVTAGQVVSDRGPWIQIQPDAAGKVSIMLEVSR